MLKKYIDKILGPKPTLTTKTRNFDFSSNYYDEPTNSISSYKQNVIVYRCVNLVSQAASHVPWQIFTIKGGNRHLEPYHPAAKLLKKPSANKGGAEFFSELISSKMLFGNSYILAAGPDKIIPKEIYLLQSQGTNIVIEQGRAIAYKYHTNSGTKLYPINPVTRMSRVLHVKNYNPSNSLVGLSCLDAAAASIEVHNMASRWNSNLLKNGARPSGALVVKDGNGYLSDEQFDRIREELNEKYTGSARAGRPMILEGGLDWREMSISPKDMDFIESKNAAAREIALAFGVPPQLLGINGDNTYSNMQEARLALWEETLIPLLDKLSDSMSNWFSYLFGEEIIVDFDRDAISALTDKRENLWDKIKSSDFMTINEKRHFVGLSPIQGGDVLC